MKIKNERLDMDLSISSEQVDDYVLVKVKGKVTDFNGMKEVTNKIYNEIAKYNLKKIILDQRENSPPEYVTYQAKLSEYYIQCFPDNMRRIKLAVITDEKHKHLAEFWKTYTTNRGFKFQVFYSFQDACDFIKQEGI